MNSNTCTPAPIKSARHCARQPLAQSGKAARWVLIALVLIGGGAAGWWWQHRGVDATAQQPQSAGRRAGNGQATQPVSVMPVGRRDVHVVVQAIGAFAASNTAVVHAQVSGVLQSLLFQEGQQVKAGQTLAQIDPRAFQASLSQAEGTFARDKAQLDNARVDLTRYQELFAKDALAKQQLDTQAALVRQLEGTVKSDQAAVDTARLQMTYTRVLAPIPGRVGLKQIDIGNVVQPGDANGIVSITQTRPIALVFAVPSAVLPKITAALRNNQALPVQALDRGSKTPLAEGLVATIDNAIDATTDTIRIKALFPNADDSLFPNQAVSVALQVDTLHDTLAVPPAAVLRGTKGAYVYVVNADNTVATRVVKPGTTEGNWMAVEGDLKPGERVVIDGVDRLRDGAKVEVITPDAKQSSGGGAGEAERGHRLDKLPPEVAAKVQAMSPQDRRAWFQQHRGEFKKPSAPSN